jgi:hypothetical protein
VTLRLFLTLAFFAGCSRSCPSVAGGACDPRDANCPTGYSCAMAEICTKRCELPSDCWLRVESGCRSNYMAGMRLPDGGVYVESTEDGYCTESKSMICLDGYCQREDCSDGDGGNVCDYDVYGPSPFKGNRSQGPAE